MDGIAGVIFVQGLVELTDDEEDRLVSSSGTNSWLCPLLLSSTSTTTSSSGLGLTWPSDIVRDTVNNQLIFGGQADVQELLFRLVARQRHLTHMQRLLMAAMEEALPWLHRSLSAEAFNAANTDEAVWNSVVAESVHGSGPSSSTPNHVVQAPMLLLGPGLPDSMEGVLSTLPDVPPMVIPFLRRRAWQQHVRALQGTGGIRGPTDRDQNNNDNNDRVLHLVQRDESIPVYNWPADVPRPANSVRDRGRYVRGRRRHHQRRPPPRHRRQGAEPATRFGDDHVSLSLRSSLPLPRAEHADLEEHEQHRRRGWSSRNRSRSRDP